MAQKILLAAGIFYPDVGGPAIHVMKIAERLSKEGFLVTVLAYGEDKTCTQFPFKVVRVSRRLPKIIQWLWYLICALREASRSALVYAFDPTAAGVPASFAAKLFGKPFVIRIGGDPIWERVIEKGKRFITIQEYYENGLYRVDSPSVFKTISKVLERSGAVVVYNQFFKDFYHKYFGIEESKIHIVKNPVFKRESAAKALSDNPMIIFAGRFVAYKNLPMLISAFAKVRQKLQKGRLLLIGKGPDESKLKQLVGELSLDSAVTFVASLPQDKLFLEIKNADIAVGPALNEFNPNFILEALSFGKPVLLSRGHGLSVDLPDVFLFDPLKESELEGRIANMFDQAQYAKATDEVARLDLNQTWDKVTDFHLDLIKKTCQK